MPAIALALLLTASLPQAEGLSRPANLRCEFVTNPIGLDPVAPRLSWEVVDTRRGAMQSAYQIVVNDDRGVVWDSGKIASDQSIHVRYAGKPLQSRTRYFWKVRTWDRAGKPSPWSAAAFWEMGLLTPADWKAQWIAQTAPSGEASMGKWIWHPDTMVDNGRALLRRTFTIDPAAKIAKASIRITADNVMTLFVNGKRIGDHHAWETLAEYDVASSLRPGKNVLAVDARNEDGPCGVVAALTITYEGGKRDTILTDDQWRASADAQGDWTAPDFDDSSWVKAKVVGNYGDAPWATGGASGPKRSFYARKEFQAPAAIKHATAHVTGLGLYDLTINGKRVGDEYFTPGWTQYNKRVQYRAYDVTALLTKGGNAIGAVLGNGWWSGGMAFGTSNYSPADQRLLVQLEIDYAGGRHDTVVTDGTWKLHDSPIVENTFYHGETYDARLELPGWDKPGFDDKTWQPAAVYNAPLTTLFAQRGPAILAHDELAPIAITQPTKGVYVFDFGQNRSGVCRLKVRGPVGTRVQIRFAEVLKPDGNIYTENYRSARATDVYTLRGDGEEVWQPRFTYRGFRYAELTGYPGPPAKDALTSVAINSEPPIIGGFKCSNDLLNRIYHNILWGQRSNMMSVPTDCPQRDERLGWTGDAAAFAPTACWNMDMASFFEKWVRDLADSQAPDGCVPDVAPTPSPNAGAPAWADAIVIVPWTLYNFYGDTGIIEENYDAMRAWVEYMHRHAPKNLYEREGYGDWVAPVGTPSRPVGAAYYYWSTRLLSRMADAIGKQDDARKYGALADEIADAFNNAYLDKRTNNYPGATQTANLLPLAFGIVPEGRRAAVAENVAKDARSRGYHLSTGFLGTSEILPMLTDFGWQDVAGGVAVQRTYPSWGYMVDKGATTIWELWNSDTEGPGMNSRNHFALGSVGEWYYEGLAGLSTDPRAPGFKRLLVRPAPCADVTWVDAGFRSMCGPVRSAWKIAKGDFVVKLIIPANTTAEVSIPMGQGTRVLEGGVPIEKSPGVKLIGLTRTPFGADGGGTRAVAVCEVGAGTYEITVPGYAPGG